MRQILCCELLKVIQPAPELVVGHQPRRGLQQPHGMNHQHAVHRRQRLRHLGRRRHPLKRDQLGFRRRRLRLRCVIGLERNVAAVHPVFVVGKLRHECAASLLANENAAVGEHAKRPAHRPLTHGKSGCELHLIGKHLPGLPAPLSNAIRHLAAHLFKKRFTPQAVGVREKAEVGHDGSRPPGRFCWGETIVSNRSSGALPPSRSLRWTILRRFYIIARKALDLESLPSFRFKP